MRVEDGNAEDQYAVGVGILVGHVPRELSRTFFYFLRHGCSVEWTPLPSSHLYQTVASPLSSPEFLDPDHAEAELQWSENSSATPPEDTGCGPHLAFYSFGLSWFALFLFCFALAGCQPAFYLHVAWPSTAPLICNLLPE